MEQEETESVVQEISGMSVEERAEAWANWIRAEINAALDIYLPESLSGQINVEYFPHIIEVLESGPVKDTSKADGVQLKIVFKFEKTIDLTKPRINVES